MKSRLLFGSPVFGSPVFGWRLRTGVFIRIFIITLVTVVTSCATNSSYTPAPRKSLGVVVEGPVSRYLIEVNYITQDDVGIASDYHDIRGQAIRAEIEGKPYYRWESYDIRAYVPGAPVPDFHSFEPAVGFEYFKEDPLEEDMTKIADTSSLPRTMDGFEFYINLMDFHMWDVDFAKCRLTSRP